MSFFEKQRIGRQDRSCLGIGTSGRGEDIKKGCSRMNMVKYHVLMYENGKMRSVETILGTGGEGIKEDDGGGRIQP
jgi:hypothetical protein